MYDHPEELDKSPVIPTRAKAAAVLSLSIPLCGRLIGCYEPNEGKALKPPRIAEKTDQTLKKPLYLQILSCVLCAIVPRARAHHSFAADYDASKPVTLRGTVN